MYSIFFFKYIKICAKNIPALTAALCNGGGGGKGGRTACIWRGSAWELFWEVPYVKNQDRVCKQSDGKKLNVEFCNADLESQKNAF